MNHTLTLMLRYTRGSANLNCCVNFRLEKERYTPYTELHGRWYCPAGTNIGEVLAVMFYIDGTVRHYGYPTDISFSQKDGRLFLDVSSVGYTAALGTNQCPDGLHTDINLNGLVTAGVNVPNVVYQQGTPTVSYVNYYDGTSLWDAIVCYAVRSTGYYPYIYGFNTVRVSPHEDRKTYSTETKYMISRGNSTDYTRLISKISEKDVDGTPNAFNITSGIATARSIVRCREINFDREWIMDPEKGLQHRINYATRKLNVNLFRLPDILDLDLLDMFSVTDIRYSGEVDLLRISGDAQSGFTTEIGCYTDSFCPAK